MTGITLGSLFDGIGGFPLAAGRNGITSVWASEIEPFPIKVTTLRFPNMIHLGDIKKLDGSKLTPVDIVTGGSPCQDLSVAGKRAGLAGARSGLFMEQIRVIREMRKEDERNGRTGDLCRPRYMVWENVPGAFSSCDGEDFRAVLEETCRVADSSISVPRPPDGAWLASGAIVGDQFSVAWRVLDAQYWSLAQRRRRIFLVADFGGKTAPEILFESDRLQRHPAQGEGQRQGAARGIEESAGASGYGETGIGFWRDGIQTLRAEGENRPSRPSSVIVENKDDKQTPIAFACNQRDEVRNLNDVSGALQAQPGMKQQTFIADPGGAKVESNCLTPWDTQQERIFTENSVSPTLTGADGGGGRNPAGLLFAAGVVTKGNGDAFITPERHTSLSAGGGQAGQGYPCVMTMGFSAGASPKAGSIGYQEECSPTLKASESGTNMVPSILCLNDQGGKQMDCSESVTGTLRAQEHGHQPLVMATQQGGAEICEVLCPSITAAAGMSGNNQPVLFENHGIDARYSGPLDKAPTVTARFGTGGNNVPLAMSATEAYAIAGNIIDRKDKNGGNGIGIQKNVSYTLTSTDQHCVFSLQRSDIYRENDVTSTQSARQYKDATDLVCAGDVAGVDCRNGQENGNLCGTLQSHQSGGYSLNTLHPVRIGKYVRRLTPLECERLMGFPDGWTALGGATDSARYKALGNSVAITCVDFVLRGIAYFMRKFKESGSENNCISTPTT